MGLDQTKDKHSSAEDMREGFAAARDAAQNGQFDAAVKSLTDRSFQAESEEDKQLRHEANKTVILALCNKLGTFVTGFLGTDLAPEPGSDV